MVARRLSPIAVALAALLLGASCSASGSSETIVTLPQGIDPRTSEPESTEPKTTEPRTTEPETTEPRTTEPDPDPGERPDPSKLKPGKLTTKGAVKVGPGQPGKVTAVAIGAPDKYGSVAVVVRNATERELINFKVTLAAKTADGTFVGSATAYADGPGIIAPGGWGFGSAFFTTDLPAGVTFDAVIEGEEDREWVIKADLTVGDLATATGRYDNRLITGTITNTSGLPITGAIRVSVACFDASGTKITHVADGWPVDDVDRLDVGESTEFEVDLFDDPCPLYSVGSTGLIA